jgi:hypothetical protein
MKVETSVDGEPIDPKRWQLTLTNDCGQVGDGSWLAAGSVPMPEVSFSATFEVDQEAYDQFVGVEQLVTVKQTYDLNPWHRSTAGARAKVGRLRAIIGWEFQRRVLRRKLAERVEMTVPNCRVVSSNGR